MWVTTHVIAGLAIAATLGGPWWQLLVAVVASHVLLDLVPHWDYTASRRPRAGMYADVVASLTAFTIAWPVLGYPWWVAIMGLVSGAPDLDVLAWMVRGEKGSKIFPSHWDRFPHGRSGPVWGIGIQAAIMVAGGLATVALAP